MIGPLISALVAAGSAGLQANAMGNQNALNWAALNETKRANRKTESMARSTRRDVYGNEMEYIDGVGWVPNLTDATKRILGGEQKERIANLTEDAPRNRAAAVRMDDRSRMADDEFEKVFNEYKFRRKPNKAQSISDATQSLLGTRRKGLDEAAALLARQLLRTGGSSQLASVFKQADDAYAGSLEEATLKGKQLGEDNYNREIQSDMANRTGELGFLRGIADQTTTSPVNFSSFNSDLSGRADAALQQLIGAVESGRGATAQGYVRLAEGYGNSPDLSGLASALAKLSFQNDQGNDRDLPKNVFPATPNKAFNARLGTGGLY